MTKGTKGNSWNSYAPPVKSFPDFTSNLLDNINARAFLIFIWVTSYALAKLVFNLFIVSLDPNTTNNNTHFIYVSSVFSRVQRLHFLGRQEIKSTQFKCWFLVRGESWSTRGKTSHSRIEKQQTQPTYDVRSGNRTRATLVEGQSSRHCANSAL